MAARRSHQAWREVETEIFRQTLRQLHNSEYSQLLDDSAVLRGSGDRESVISMASTADAESDSGGDGCCSSDASEMSDSDQRAGGGSSSSRASPRAADALPLPSYAGAKPTTESLRDMLLMLRRRELPPFEDTMSLVDAAIAHFDPLPNVVRMDVPAGGRLIVVGDIHGQIQDLNFLLECHGGPSETTAFLFNGDFVDRGHNSVEVLLTLLCLVLLLPRSVYLNRGNHEDDIVNKKYGFMSESANKYGKEFYRKAQQLFLRLPLMHIVSEKICVVHGGLSQHPGVTIKEIDSIDRKQPPKFKEQAVTKSEKIYQALLWSDPKDFTDGTDFGPSIRGAGVMWGKGLTKQFLDANNLDFIVRAHEVCSSGYTRHHNGKVVTVFSASNYCGMDDNQGCHMVIHPNLQFEYVQHSVLVDPLLLATGCTRMKQDSWKVDAKRHCLALLRQAIFAHRQELLHAFQIADRRSRGTCSLAEWVAACKKVVHPGLPWYTLSSYLVVKEGASRRVVYMSFLERFQNRLARKWMVQWAAKVKPYIAERLASYAERRGRPLTYFELCQVVRDELPGLKERSVYYLLVILCPGGRASARQLRAAVSADDEESARFSAAAETAPCVLDLWVLSAFRKDSWRSFQTQWHKTAHWRSGHSRSSEQLLSASREEHLYLAGLSEDSVRNVSASSSSFSHTGSNSWLERLGRDEEEPPMLPREDFISVGLQACNQVGKAARERWEATAAALDPAGVGFVKWGAVVDAVGELGSEWSRASQVLDVLATCARATVGLQDVFDLMDTDRDGFVSFEEFEDAIHGLAGRRLTDQEVGLLFRALAGEEESQDAGTPRFADFNPSTVRLTAMGIARGLEVVDMWDQCGVREDDTAASTRDRDNPQE